MKGHGAASSAREIEKEVVISTGGTRTPRKSSKRVPRFAFQKSAIYCRFLKVRRANTHAGCLLAQDDTRGEFIKYQCFQIVIAVGAGDH